MRFIIKSFPLTNTKCSSLNVVLVSFNGRIEQSVTIKVQYNNSHFIASIMN